MDCFNLFNDVDINTELPSFFTNPFDYEPHNLCLKASTLLQSTLEQPSPSSKGKMYGVLVAKNRNGELGFICAYSGNEKEFSSSISFVPQVCDITNKRSFFKQGEAELNALNLEIKKLENSPELVCLKEKLKLNERLAKQAIEDAKTQLTKAKAIRDNKRKALCESANSEKEKAILIKESQTEKSKLKKLKKYWSDEINNLNDDIRTYQNEMAKLKSLRKIKSALLQERLFNNYRFLNKHGALKSASEIFKTQSTKIPPAGAGDCAAPKLLQYAFQNQLQPVAMAEFWWGESPKTEIRKHGYFYPACKSKCEPILAHMLKDFTFEKTAEYITSKDIQYIYEDDAIAIINKPFGLLSIPGKLETDSVYTRIKEKYPNASGPLLVHRLDMATSGLMLIAKNKDAHENLQKQFLKRTIKKRYVAILDGIIDSTEGTISLPLRVDINDRPRQLVCFEHGKPATTKWKVIDRTMGQTRIHFFPITGRTHQLRVHASHHLGLNTPIVGDNLYGKKAERLMLHAEKIEFLHPTKLKTVCFVKAADF